MNPRNSPNWTMVEAAHLLNRAGFGACPSEIESWHALGPEAAVARLVSGPAKTDVATDPPDWARPEVFRQSRESLEKRIRSARNDPDSERETQRREAQRQARRQAADQGVELAGWWLQRMISSEDPLRENMTLFWHGHFATSIEKVREPYFLYLQNECFRKHGLGDFGTLLYAVVRDPAMMLYLDLAKSRRTMPNENFARELMELFTLGEGHYSEADIKAAARAFTGLRVNRMSGETRFSRSQHDDGEKEFFGEKGCFGPRDIVDILLKQEQCARFLARKLLRHFVNDAPSDAEVEEFARVLRAEKFQIGASLRRLFLSGLFYERRNVRAMIKSPVAYLVQMTRQMELAALPERLAQGGLRAMGQRLFAPPNVAGWPGGAAWITTNTLFARYNIAGLVTRAGDPEFSFEGMGSGKSRGKRRRGPNGPDYARIAPASLRADPAKLVDSLVFRLFQFPLRPDDRDKFLAHARPPSGDIPDDVHIARLVHLMMSTPYYQLT